ncbi:Stk1 family PASTA domain-containing Ser/Thr kinase [Paenibacillus sp. F411]|uniref:Stk1 family PASTA domain-containing Ser/Thr kinase n=1 Tax=Paenibacillus sp. F411 TaxID=2820239 RepID=UPI001AAEC463|nr:Stk1 family PASTA domain-containing Ser/Thr kinase [Paenibacillus sp. F411]MBO2944975.1 Stk1 family PASTA domain-containing Ser/Thr kinase [Paenibacillus sp. F411]
MIGHELAGRYKVIERIGGGGMALVYKAQDILLNRHVAIKVLRQQFVHDEEFIRRFRREAQSAASLSHPNVVSIYDVGQEDDVHYIVMECIDGNNLNEIIKERAPLQVDEAVRIASQICDALEHAHQNQIIHRDIKPHNILIGRNGRVKVTDFGIARAVTSTTITQTGSVVGSVHYFSPEHAKGVATGEKSDLYSLGIVLYQMLTGRLPFLGESPISVALKHLQEEFEEPKEVNALIPQSVENVILKSMRKNPQERYQSAEEMLQDLETCLLPARRNEPKIQFHDDADQTIVMPALKSMQPAGATEAYPGPENYTGPPAPNASSGDVEDDGVRKEMVSERKSGKQSKKKPALIVGLSLLFLAIIAGLVLFVNQMLEVKDVTVPGVITMAEAEAVRTLEEAGLVVNPEVLREYKEGVEAGIVLKQSRAEGTVVKEGASVQLTVGEEKPLSVMPSLSGRTLDEAMELLAEQKVDKDAITVREENSDSAAAGEILSQSPDSGVEFDPDEANVMLVVSKGKAEVEMTDLTTMTRSEAENEIKRLGLKVGTVKDEPSFTAERGTVLSQWPWDAGAMATPGTEQNIVVSSGYPSDALNYTFKVPVAPSALGESSRIRIVYSDARGDSAEAIERDVNATEIIPVELVLAPGKDGTVTIYRDGRSLDTYVVAYNDAKNGTVPEPEVEPPLPIVPEVPAVTEPENGDGSAEGTGGTGAEGNGNTETPGEAKGKDKDKNEDKKKDPKDEDEDEDDD